MNSNPKLQQVKDAVARECSYNNWDHLKQDIIPDGIIDEVMLRYADSKWVNVKDELPELEKQVLCCNIDNGYFTKAYLNRISGHLYWESEVETSRLEHFTHWMEIELPDKM